MHLLITKITESYNPAYGRENGIKKSGYQLKLELKKCLFTPVLAPLLLKRWLNCILAGFGVIQLLLEHVGLAGWQCPIYSTSGLICPGCGLTTAGLLLLKGSWRPAVEIHAFALPLLSGILVMGTIGILPTGFREKAVRKVAAVERRTGIVTILLFAMILYWLLRILNIL